MRSTTWRFSAAGFLVVFLLFILAAPGNAGVVVTNANDSGAGSLRQALADVESGGIITFDSSFISARITLTSGTLTVDRDVILEGPGADRLTLSGGDFCRVFDIVSASADISGLTVTEGSADDGGAFHVSDGNLILTECLVTSNASRVQGAAINSSNSDLTLTNCRIADNGTDEYSDGGAIYISGGSLSMTSCEISGNSALGTGTGISSRGGAIYASVPTVNLTSCFFSENRGADGGAIYADSVGSLTVASCYFSGNSASTLGGAIFARGASLSVEDSTFGDNLAIQGAGAYLTESSSLSMLNSTLSGNTAQGIFDGMAGSGGGICSYGGSLSFTNCTFGANNATDAGSGVYTSFGTLALKNTIIAGNDGNCDLFSGHEFQTPPDSRGFNLVGTVYAGGSSIWAWLDSDIVSADIVSADIFAGSLADNGGPEAGLPGAAVSIPTLALFEGSLAEDAGAETGLDGMTVVSADQRGVSRPQGSSSDIGAFELAAMSGDDDDPAIIGGNSGCSAGVFTPALGMLLVPLLLLIRK